MEEKAQHDKKQAEMMLSSENELKKSIEDNTAFKERIHTLEEEIKSLNEENKVL